MYKLFDINQEFIDGSDEILYTKKSASGCFIEATPIDAISFVSNGKVYRLQYEPEDEDMNNYPYASPMEVSDVIHNDSITDFNNILKDIVKDYDEIQALVQKYYPGYWTKGQVLHLIENGYIPVEKVLSEDSRIYLSDEEIQENMGTFIKGKISEVSKSCDKIIEAGVNVHTSHCGQDEVEHFSADTDSQNNVANLYNLVVAGATQYPYHADGKECSIYTAEDIIKIYAVMQYMIVYNITYFNMLRIHISNQTDIEEIKKIQYGCELPEDLKNLMETNLRTAQAENQKILDKISMIQGQGQGQGSDPQE